MHVALLAAALFSVAVASGSESPGHIVLLRSDTDGRQFSYPRVFVGPSSFTVGTHSRSAQSSIVQFPTDTTQNISDIASTDHTYPPGSAHPFDDISEFDLTSDGCVFTGSVGSTASCVDQLNDPTTTILSHGYLPSQNSKSRPRPTTSSVSAVEGLYFARHSDRVAVSLGDTNTPIPDKQDARFGSVAHPTSDGESVAFYGCGQGVRGVYFRSNYTKPLVTAVSSNTLVPGSIDKFSDFLSTSVSGNTVAFFGDRPSHLPAPRTFLGGVYVADLAEDSSFVVTPIAQCDPSLTNFTAFGDPVVDGDTVAFVALETTGDEAIYTSQRRDQAWSEPKAAVRAGQSPPGAGGAVFAQFPQPPSVCGDELVFRAYTSDGETGIFFLDSHGVVSTLVSTRQQLLNRTVVYMGSAQHAYGGCRHGNRVVTFYASTTNANGKDAYDGIYMLTLDAKGAELK
eukprot:TRINITY_DN28183_c0_g1_i2.p1 TRINITY_DN28183_c0_g1~~TRINITY_DN28183_c0_g1_i2.p1  ORF type:complete len:454 (-),score=59.81 TRINITY_DN28183_c0_g1_i2:208-1569(-)